MQFSLSHSPGTLGFRYQLWYPRSHGNPPVRAPNETGMRKKQQICKCPTNKSPCLGNDRRWAYSYNGRLIAGWIWAFNWYQFRWPWTTVTHYLTCIPFPGLAVYEDGPILSAAKHIPGSVEFSDVQIVYKLSS